MVRPVLWCPTSRPLPGALSKKGGGSARETWRALRAKREGKTAAPSAARRSGTAWTVPVRYGAEVWAPRPPRPPYPHEVKENRARVRAPEGRESRQSRPYTYASSPEPPGARTELRLYRCAPELVRSLLVPAVLRVPLLLPRRLAPCRKWCSMLRRRSRFIQSLGRV